MATSKEVVEAALALKIKTDALPGLVDALEQKVKDAVANAGGVPADVQADLDKAFDTLKNATASVDAAQADADNGVE